MNLTERELTITATALSLLYKQVENTNTSAKEEIIEICKKLSEDYLKGSRGSI